MPFELHRYVIGQKGSGIRKMMDEFEVGPVLVSWLGILYTFVRNFNLSTNTIDFKNPQVGFLLFVSVVFFYFKI